MHSYSSNIPRRHAFASAFHPHTARPDVDDDGYPPWTPRAARLSPTQTLPMDVADAVSSIWIEAPAMRTAADAYCDAETETDSATCTPDAYSETRSVGLAVPWLDRIAFAFDAVVVAALAVDAQLLHRPEQAFADVCWATLKHDVVEADSVPAASIRPPAAAPEPDSTAPASAAQPPSALQDTPGEDEDAYDGIQSEFTGPNPYDDTLGSDSGSEYLDDTETATHSPAPPYGEAPRAIDEHNRLIGAPFAETINFTPLRRRDLLGDRETPRAVDEHNRLLGAPFADTLNTPLWRHETFAKGDPDPAHIEPFPRHPQQQRGPDAARTAALFMLQPQPLAHWHISGSVATAEPVGAYPASPPTRSAKAPGRFFAYLNNARATPQSPRVAY